MIVTAITSPVPRYESGTYNVNHDCTDQRFSAAEPPIPLPFVIVNNGKQINNVVDGNAMSVVAYRVR